MVLTNIINIMTENIEQLVRQMISVGCETEYLEFKTGFDKEIVGERISAIANSSALLGRDFGYIIFGIKDKTIDIVGTDFDPDREKEGNMPIINWLNQHIEPRSGFEFYRCTVYGKKLVILKIPAVSDRPIQFKKVKYIRVGEVTRKLNDFPEKEKKIWNNSKNRNFENGIALEGLNESEVLKLLDFDKYFQLTRQELPKETSGFITKMAQDRLVTNSDDGSLKITVLGAISIARNLKQFPILSRKSIRVIRYKNVDRVDREAEREGNLGYAVGFENLVEYINTQVPNNEEIKKALRVEKKVYPEVAIREFVANALIHQDFSIGGSGPLIEIFSNRIEITNPGVPLIDIDRFIDHAPRSRNESLAGLMRRMKFCEESGSGVDRALFAVEVFQLPAPKFETHEDFTRVTLFSFRPLKEMSEEDKIRACYQHCALKAVSGSKMTNTSLRGRLGIDEKNYPMASKIIKSTIEKGLIKESDKPKEYVPWWA